MVAGASFDPSLEGKSIARINKERGRKDKLEDQIETVLDILEKGTPGMVYHVMDERDVERILRAEHTMVASDAGPVEFEKGVPHPRGYGTNARVLARYVREDGALSLIQALRKMSLMPAQRLEARVPEMRDKGRVRTGAHADLAIFDPATIRDVATYERPAQLSQGMRYVLVNGAFVVRDGEVIEGATPGRPVRAPIVP